MTAKTLAKAARLVRDGKVTELPAMGGGCRHWIVAGTPESIPGTDPLRIETPSYYVTTRVDRSRCACKQGIIAMQTGAEPRCSHAAAALYAART